MEGLLHRLILAAASADPFSEAMRELLVEPASQMGADKVTLLALKPDMSELEVVFSGYPLDMGRRFRLDEAPGYIREAVTSGSTIHISDPRSDPRVEKDEIEWRRFESLTSVPLTAYGEMVGVLILYYPERTELDPGSEKLIQAIAALAALRLEKLRWDEERRALEWRIEEVRIDCPLTGLYNMRFFRRRLEEEVSRSLRYNRPLSLIIFDIDGLDEINAAYGRPVGDLVLVEFAKILKYASRISDVAARYMGDEFALLAVETGPKGARALAERLVDLLKRRRIAELDVELTVTCCAGTASMPSPHIFSHDGLLNAAYKALSEAKSIGRGAVASFEEL